MLIAIVEVCLKGERKIEKLIYHLPRTLPVRHTFQRAKLRGNFLLLVRW